MRSSKIKSPSHYDKVCVIAVEAIVQMYTNKNEFYKSNLFSYIYDGTLNILGTLSSNNHHRLLPTALTGTLVVAPGANLKVVLKSARGS